MSCDVKAFLLHSTDRKRGTFLHTCPLQARFSMISEAAAHGYSFAECILVYVADVGLLVCTRKYNALQSL